MARIFINNQDKYEFTKSSEGISLDGEKMNWDILLKSSKKIHLILNNRSVTADIIKENENDGHWVIRIAGEDYDIRVDDDKLKDSVSINKKAGLTGIVECKAPMPGQVVSIEVKIGDTVKKGEPLLVLKAMKMENIIQSPGNGKVTSILITEGDTVIKGQVMVRF
jgi:biotin carboxyl carrier protein